MRRWLLPSVLCLVSADSSLQYGDFAPQTTSPPEIATDAALNPEPTRLELAKRAETVDPNICGFYSGPTYWVWSYNDPAQTCFWNTDSKVIGDGYIQTACSDGTDGDYGTGVARCSSPNSNCLTFFYTDNANSDSDYRAFICTNTPGISWHLEATWSGLTTPIAFPVYTGSNGISTGTQYPPGYPSPTRTTSSTTRSETTDSQTSSMTDSISPEIPGGSNTDTGSSSSSSNGGGSKSVPIGAIVGGVIGGLAVIGGIACVIIFLLLRSGRKRRANADLPPPPPVTEVGAPPVPPPETRPKPPQEYTTATPELGTQAPKPPNPGFVPPPNIPVPGAPAPYMPTDEYELANIQARPQPPPITPYPVNQYELSAQPQAQTQQIYTHRMHETDSQNVYEAP